LAVVTGNVRSSIAFSLTGAGWLGGAQLSVAPPTTPQSNYGNGTTAGNVDLIYAATLTLSATPTTLDLTSLTDPLNGAVAFARVREFYLRNNATTDGWTVVVGGGAANPWAGASQFLQASSTVTVGPSTSSTSPCTGKLAFAAPNTTGYVVDGTHKTLKLDPGANTLTVEILIVGSSV
jgi:hypothetical protein